MSAQAAQAADMRTAPPDGRQIVDMVRAAGVVGAGGAGFPTHIKLSSPAQVVIANGAECEPLSQSDRHLMLREPEGIVRGLMYAMRAVGAARGILAVKAKHADVVARLRPLAQAYEGVELLLLEDFYPAGDEHVLVYEAIGRPVPMGGLPLAAGAVVQNVHTLHAVAGAMQGRPFTHRYVTVAGEVNRPAVARVAIGTPLRAVIDQVGHGAVRGDCAVIVGGPMMGRIEDDPDAPVLKTTGAVLVLPRDCRVVALKTQDQSTAARRARSACCQCRFCTDLCPRFLLGHSLEPHKAMRVLAHAGGPFNAMDAYTALLCTGCNLCGYYACTMGLQPNAINALFKQALAKGGIRGDFSGWAQGHPGSLREGRKVPLRRLVARLGLEPYAGHLPFDAAEPQPALVSLPLQQHIGAPAIPVVKAGDQVRAGQLVAQAPQGVGAGVHSPYAGIVQSVSGSVVIRSRAAQDAADAPGGEA